MRSQAHDDEDEEQTEPDESRGLLSPSTGLSRVGSGSIGTKRTGLLWTAGASRSKPPFSAYSSGAAADAAPPTAPSFCRPSAFVLDLSMLVRVFFVRGLFIEQRWLFPLLLACTAVGYEVAASTVLNVIGEFYLAISSMDTPLFLQASGIETLCTAVVFVAGMDDF